MVRFPKITAFGLSLAAASSLTYLVGVNSLPVIAQDASVSHTLQSDLCNFTAKVVGQKRDAGLEVTAREEAWESAVLANPDAADCAAPPLETSLPTLLVLAESDVNGSARMSEELGEHLRASVPANKFYDISMSFFEGDWGILDSNTGLYWLAYAADMGDPDAIYEYAQFTKDGIMGVGKDPEEALKMEQLAAEKGSGMAMYALGVRHFNGDLLKQSPKQAEKWMQKSAEHGYIDAAYLLANAYGGLPGYGLSESQKKGQKYALIAARAGNADAMALYATFLLTARNNRKTQDQVFYWLNKSADAGNQQAVTVLNQYGDELRNAYAKANKPMSTYEPPKQCPTVNRCTVYTNQYGPTGERYCAPQTDYWNC